MTRIFSFLILLSSTASSQAAENMCVGIFQKQATSLGDFSEIDSQQLEVPTASGDKRGNVTLTGRNRFTQEWTTVGSIDYTIKGNTVFVNRLTERPELYGQGIYTRMFEQILQKNLNVQAVTISLTGSFFREYKEDLATTNDPKAAVEANSVYQQFARLGFGDVASLFELANTQEIFLRLTFARPSH